MGCTREFSDTLDVPGISLGTDTSVGPVVSEILLAPGSSAGPAEPASWSPLPLDTSLC